MDRPSVQRRIRRTYHAAAVRAGRYGRDRIPRYRPALSRRPECASQCGETFAVGRSKQDVMKVEVWPIFSYGKKKATRHKNRALKFYPILDGIHQDRSCNKAI